jgi:hypothetical protein
VCAATARGWCFADVAGCRRRYRPRRGGGDAACRRRRRLGDGSRAQAAATAAAARAAARRRTRTAARGCRQLGRGGRSSGGRQLLATPGRRWSRRSNLTSRTAQAVVPCGRPVGWSGRLRRTATRGAAARCGAARPGATRRVAGGSGGRRNGGRSSGRRGGGVGGGGVASVALCRANASDALRAAWDECGGAPRVRVQAPSPPRPHPHSHRCPRPCSYPRPRPRAIPNPLLASSSHPSAHSSSGTPPAPLHSCRATLLPTARHASRGGGRPLLVPRHDAQTCGGA